MENNTNKTDDLAVDSVSAGPHLECPECNHKFNEFEQVDVCQYCEKDFGLSGEDENGFNSSCVHCGENLYTQCCPNCRETLPVEMWIGENT